MSAAGQWDGENEPPRHITRVRDGDGYVAHRACHDINAWHGTIPVGTCDYCGTAGTWWTWEHNGNSECWHDIDGRGGWTEHPLRILITGSRDWRDARRVQDAILAAATERLPPREPMRLLSWPDVVVVHGDARGADGAADHAARRLGMRVDVHPADWRRDGRAAGPLRNQRMVDLGADIVLAFPLGESRGTRDCMRRATTAGIPVRVIEPRGVSDTPSRSGASE